MTMQRKSLTMALAIAGVASLITAAPGFANDTGGSTNGAAAAAQTGTAMGAGPDSMNAPSARRESMGMRPGDSSMRSGQSFDKTGQDEWVAMQAQQHNGRISRQAYMDEMSRRWNAMDQNQQGLTPAEVSRLFGNVDSAAGPARTGSGVQAGNMGPGNQKR